MAFDVIESFFMYHVQDSKFIIYGHASVEFVVEEEHINIWLFPIFSDFISSHELHISPLLES